MCWCSETLTFLKNYQKWLQQNRWCYSACWYSFHFVALQSGSSKDLELYLFMFGSREQQMSMIMKCPSVHSLICQLMRHPFLQVKTSGEISQMHLIITHDDFYKSNVLYVGNMTSWESPSPSSAQKIPSSDKMRVWTCTLSSGEKKCIFLCSEWH